MKISRLKKYANLAFLLTLAVAMFVYVIVFIASPDGNVIEKAAALVIIGALESYTVILILNAVDEIRKRHET